MKRLTRLVILIALLLITRPLTAQIASAGNTKFAAMDATPTLTALFSNAQTSGNANIARVQFCIDGGCGVDTAAVTITITDTDLNTYVLIDRDDTSSVGFTVATYCATGITSAIAGANTVTATIGNASTTYLQLHISEWSGMAASPKDSAVTAHNHSAASTNPTVTTGSTSQANELIYGALEIGSQVPTPGSGYTLVATGGVDIYKIVSTVGAQVVNWTAASDQWIVGGLGFKAANAGSTYKPQSLTTLGAGKKQ